MVEGRVPLPPQALRVFAHDYELPTISTSVIGFQRQFGQVLGFDADLVDERSITGLNRFGSSAGTRLRPDGSIIPVRDLKGKPLHRLDVRVAKEFKLGGTIRLAGTAEVFNLLNHENYGSYNVVQGRANYGRPTQNLGTAYQARSGQLGVRLAF